MGKIWKKNKMEGLKINLPLSVSSWMFWCVLGMFLLARDECVFDEIPSVFSVL